MTERLIFRGDGYTEEGPIFVLTLSKVVPGNPPTIEPFNMAGCKIQSTFKEAVTDPTSDPTDATAALKRDIVFDGSGQVTSSTGLQLPEGGTAAEGVLWLTATPAETKLLPLDKVLKSDVQVTHPSGEPRTIVSNWTLKAQDGYTNRELP